MTSLYKCSNCNKYPVRHCNGGGSVSVFDTPDGPSQYVCACSCAVAARRNDVAERAIRKLIEMYGRERIEKVIKEAYD